MQPDEPTDEERQQEQPQDVATPFQPADDATQDPVADDTHPNTDTDVDKDELYQEGVNAATNAPAPQDPSVDLEDASDLSDAAGASDTAAGEADDQDENIEAKSL
jgi:hypothetical protein